MQTLIFFVIAFVGLLLLPRLCLLLTLGSWGKSFHKDLIRTMSIAVLSGSVEKFYQLTKAVKTTPRIQLLWLGLNSMAFGWMLICLALTQAPFFFLQDGLMFFHQTVNFENPPVWVFWLASNDWLGLGFGFGIGVVLRLVLRFSGFSLPLATGFLVSGMMSLAVAWGFFLGDYLVGALESFFKFKAEAFRYRLKFSLAFGLAALLLSPLILGFSMDLVGGAYSTQLRWLQWISLIITFMLCETLSSLFFFHYYWKKQSAASPELTKV